MPWKMWRLFGLSRVCRTRNLLNVNTFALNSSLVAAGSPTKRYVAHYFYSTIESVSDDKEMNLGQMTLADDLACLVEESSAPDDGKPKPRWKLKRIFELRIKKRVKDQFRNGKFHDLMVKVIADPYTLRDAYNSIRVSSNVDLASECDSIPFECIAEELMCGSFDVNANIYSISSRGPNKEVLVLPNLKLNVVQEAIRIALEVVYKPDYSKISHGCRSGRGHSSALKYISKEISNPDWWFTLLVRKKLDACVLTKLISTMENKIEDPNLYAIIRSMFDAQVLNLEFGGFAKGHGLPQEGVLSPILMNIYLGSLDRELCWMSMRYEALVAGKNVENDGSHSKLRGWFRRQMNDSAVRNNVEKSSDIRVHSCRFMDEILLVISGSKEVAIDFKSMIQTYMQNSLNLNFDGNAEILRCDDPHGVRFLGISVRRNARENPAVRAVHKLKEKVMLFASQKQESWDEGTVRIGKKWLGHGLKKVKESEIKHLSDNSSLISQISRFRKAGMETDHWYKVLLKIWMQDRNANFALREESILSKYIAEPALPQELKDSFYRFQKLAEEYVSTETASTLHLLPDFNSVSESVSIPEIIAPVNAIKKRLFRYGLTNCEGSPRTCHKLVLQDTDQIIDWFSGIVNRWLRWYHFCNNFSEVKLIISHQVRMSCIRTLAVKYRIHEVEIEKRFLSELSRLPSTQDIEYEMENETLGSRNSIYDEGLFYGIYYSGLCLLSLARMVGQSRPCTCSVMGCMTMAPCIYTIHVMERQKFPGWKTGFSIRIHPSIHRRRVGLCKQHLKDLYLGRVSLQSINFGASNNDKGRSVRKLDFHSVSAPAYTEGELVCVNSV